MTWIIEAEMGPAPRNDHFLANAYGHRYLTQSSPKIAMRRRGWSRHNDGHVFPPLSRSPLAAALAAGVALLFAFGAAVVTSVISAVPASAHAALVKITPDVDAQLTTAPTEVVLEFDESVSATFATVVVSTAAGVSVARQTHGAGRQGHPESGSRPGRWGLPSRLSRGQRRWASSVGRVHLHADGDLGHGSSDVGRDPFFLGIGLSPFGHALCPR